MRRSKTNSIERYVGISANGSQVSRGEAPQGSHHSSPRTDQQGDVSQLHFGEGARSAKELLRQNSSIKYSKAAALLVERRTQSCHWVKRKEPHPCHPLREDSGVSLAQGSSSLHLANFRQQADLPARKCRLSEQRS